MALRYAELSKTLVKEIAAGTYPVGSLLPGEIELAAQHGVSRGTVRMALDDLERFGLISRRKRLGTLVQASSPKTAEYTPTISTLDELVQYGEDNKRIVHSIRNIVVDQSLSEQLGCAPGARWMLIQTSRFNPDVSPHPVAYSDVYVLAADGAKIRSSLKEEQALICDLICRATGKVVKEVRQTVRAVGMPPNAAALLDAEEGTIALQFTRQYYDQTGSLFEVAISLHPGDRFSYSTVLHRQG